MRVMKNATFVLPFSCAFVLKKIEDLDPEKGTVDVKMTLILRVKFAGLDEPTSLNHMKEVMKFVEID